MSKMKIDFVNGGQEFDLPVVSSESDIQLTIDLLKLQIRVEKETAKELGVDLKEIRRELSKAQADKNYELSDDAKNYISIVAIQLNLNESCFHRLDTLEKTVHLEKESGRHHELLD